MITLPINFRAVSVICVVLICVLVYFSFVQEAKPKEAYTAITGTIEILDKSYHQLPIHDAGKFMYLKLDNFPYVFELFTGNDPGDFSPKLNRIDKLKQGDTVTIYAYEATHINKDGINRNAMFIDKEGISYFEKGNSKKLLGIIMIFLCIGLIAFCYIMWKKGKMRY